MAILPHSQFPAPYDWAAQVNRHLGQGERRAKGVAGSGVPRIRAKPPLEWHEKNHAIMMAAVALALVVSAIVAAAGFAFLAIAVAELTK